MQEKAINPPDEEATIKKEIHDVLEQIDVLQKQSINLFDKPQLYNRVFQLLEILDTKMHDLNRFFKMPNSDKNRAIQDIFFSVRKMKEALENLKLEPHQLKFQQNFIEAIDHVRENLNLLEG